MRVHAMFEEQFANLPMHPPRRERLPGLRFRAVLSGSALVLPLVLIVVFAVFPLLIMSTDERMRLEYRGHSASARVLSAADTSGCRGSNSRRIIYAFTPEP